jgi:hypothetical protein
MAEPTVPEIVEGERVITGAARLMVIVKFCDAELVAFVAVIVYVRASAAVVGVPEISPVEVLKESPGVFEMAGDIE